MLFFGGSIPSKADTMAATEALRGAPSVIPPGTRGAAYQQHSLHVVAPRIQAVHPARRIGRRQNAAFHRLRGAVIRYQIETQVGAGGPIWPKYVISSLVL